MTYVTREVEVINATAKVFNVETEDVETITRSFYDGETEKQIEKALEKEGFKVLKVTGIDKVTYIGRMSKAFFAQNCEWYKDER